MWQVSGTLQITSQQAIKELYRAINSQQEQVIIVTGDAKKFKAFLDKRQKPSNKSTAVAKKPQNLQRAKQAYLNKDLENFMRELLASYLQIAPELVDLETEFSELGFDSLLVIRLADALQQKYTLAVEASLFFEYTRPQELISYLSSKLKNTSEEAEKVIKETNTAFTYTPHQELLTSKQKVFSRVANHSIADCTKTIQRIAIIGISGRYPMANNLEQFWVNLIQGKDCITEVPDNRWSIAEHCHPDQGTAVQLGKSYGKWGDFYRAYMNSIRYFFILPLREQNL